MPKMNLSAAEAATLKRKRQRDKAWNASVGACLETVKKRLKGSDAVSAGLLHQVANDLRKLIR